MTDNQKPRLSRVERNKREKEKNNKIEQDIDETRIYKRSNEQSDEALSNSPSEELIVNEGDGSKEYSANLSNDLEVRQTKSRMQRRKMMAQKSKEVPVEPVDKEDIVEVESKRRSRQDEQGKKDKKLFGWKRFAVILGALFILCLIGYTTIIYGGKLLVNEEKLTITPPTTIETPDGEIIWYLYDEFRLPVKLEQVPEHVQEAFIAIEDRRFYQHTGVDMRSIARAIFKDIVSRSKAEGASTLTQQLAKNLFLTNDKTFLRKTKEVMIALYLEREYSKEQILEMYLNVIYFGQGQYGIEAAANKFFFKSVDELTVEEGALLAAIVKAPNGYSPIDHPEKAKERRDLVLRKMLDEEKISEETYETAINTEMTLNVSSRKQNKAYHSYVDLVIGELKTEYGLTEEELRSHRYKIVSTINPTFQEIAHEYFQYDHYFPGNNDQVEGAFVLLDKNGGVLAATGARDYQFKDYNRVKEKRQPGSTIKPLAVYAPALMTGDFDPYSVVPDEKKVWDGWDGKPVTNVDNRYVGELSLYEALKLSKNTSAVWLLDQIGIGYAKSYLEKLGIPLEEKGLSIALGGLNEGISPMQMAEAYTSFLREGDMVQSHTVESIANYKGQVIHEHKQKKTEVFSKQVAWTMTEMLKGVVESGTATAGDYPYELAGKTGTVPHELVEGYPSNAWFVGYTPEYVTALWMGFPKSTEDNYLTGGSEYPTSLTKSILSEMNKHVSMAKTFEQPEGVVAMEDPIELPIIQNVEGKYGFGGWKLIKGTLSWEPSEMDERVVYRIYTYDEEEPELIGEVVGETTFTIDSVSLFNQDLYFVVPYNPLTKQEGNRSEVIALRF